jgi:hypothetical protein
MYRYLMDLNVYFFSMFKIKIKRVGIKDPMVSNSMKISDR